MYTYVETKLFTRLIDEYLSDEELAAPAAVLKKIKEELDGTH